MATYTTPITWSDTVPTTTQLNAQIRDNLLWFHEHIPVASASGVYLLENIGPVFTPSTSAWTTAPFTGMQEGKVIADLDLANSLRVTFNSSTNRLTLPAGTYRFQFIAGAHSTVTTTTQHFYFRVQNITDSATLGVEVRRLIGQLDGDEHTGPIRAYGTTWTTMFRLAGEKTVEAQCRGGATLYPSDSGNKYRYGCIVTRF